MPKLVFLTVAGRERSIAQTFSSLRKLSIAIVNSIIVWNVSYATRFATSSAHSEDIVSNGLVIYVEPRYKSIKRAYAVFITITKLSSYRAQKSFDTLQSKLFHTTTIYD